MTPGSPPAPMAQTPDCVALGLLLIGFGLVYPMAALFRTNQQLGKREVSRAEIVALLALNALLPLNSVLIGFWILSERVRTSPLFLGALAGSALFLLIALFVRWRVRRE